MRHGECFNNYKNNPGLTISGIRDIEKKVKIIKQNFDLNKIFCSHKKRAQETANIFLKNIPNLKMKINSNLREVSLYTTEEEKNRINYEINNFILTNIKNNDLIIISHMNFLTNIVNIISNTNKEYFNEYGSAIKIFKNYKIKILF